MECKICKINEETNKKRNMCVACLTREWRQKNQKKVKLYARKRYLRDKEKILEYTQQWQKDNHERYRAGIRKRRKKNPKHEAVIKKTIHFFRDLRDNGVCEVCKGKTKLEFHHIKPYRYDVFKILCRKCHLKVHKKEEEEKFRTWLSS